MFYRLVTDVYKGILIAFFIIDTLRLMDFMQNYCILNSLASDNDLVIGKLDKE